MSGEDLAAAPPWLGELVRRSQEAMAAYDLAGTIVYVNEAAGRLLLVEPAELVGTSVFDLIDAEDLGRVGANLDAVADGAQPRPRAHQPQAG